MARSVHHGSKAPFQDQVVGPLPNGHSWLKKMGVNHWNKSWDDRPSAFPRSFTLAPQKWPQPKKGSSSIHASKFKGYVYTSWGVMGRWWGLEWGFLNHWTFLGWYANMVHGMNLRFELWKLCPWMSKTIETIAPNFGWFKSPTLQRNNLPWKPIYFLMAFGLLGICNQHYGWFFATQIPKIKS